MKRIHAVELIVLTLAAAVLLTGCFQNDYEAFAEANALTQDIEQGAVQHDVRLNLDLETQGTEGPAQNIWRDVRLTWTERFDRKDERAQHDIYLNLGGLGFDAVVHERKEETLVHLPGTGSYLKPFEEETEQAQTFHIGTRTFDVASAGGEFERIGNRIAALWMDTLRQDNVFRREEVLIDTPAGLVKSDRYAIEMDEELLAFSQGVFEILKEEEMLPKDAQLDVSNLEVETFTVHAYVDLDGYVVKEEVELEIIGRDPVFRGLDMTWETLRFDIEEPQSLAWPDVSEEEFLSNEQLSQESPALFDLLDGEAQR